jgi:hypothetical protein
LPEDDDRDSLKTLNMLYVHSYFYFDSGQCLRTFLKAEIVSTSFTTVYFNSEKKFDVVREAVVQLLHYSSDSRITDYDIVEVNIFMVIIFTTHVLAS